MQLYLATAAFAAGTLMSAVSFAATVDVIQGNVSINHGGGFQPVSGSTQAKSGDTIMVRSGGQAQITYENGCTHTATADGVYVVQDNPTCEAGFTETNFLVGAAVVGGVVGAVILLNNNNNNDKPASP